MYRQVDCVWSAWSPATSCTKTCGGGKKLQTRTIIKHEQNGGDECVNWRKHNVKETDCNTDECPPGKSLFILFVFVVNVHL